MDRKTLIFAASLLPLSVAAWVQVPQSAQTDPVSELDRQIRAGNAQLVWEPGTGYLRSVLGKLGVPANSQTLVFSKTSLQTEYITPKNPRAIYYNDQTYVAFIPGAPLIEIMSVHPVRGPRFFTIENRQTKRPRFETGLRCAVCHGVRSRTASPNLFAMSATTTIQGEVLPSGISVNLSSRLPFEDRWGGWYVTGTHGNARHLGNAFAVEKGSSYTLDTSKAQNLTSLAGKFDSKKYLSGHSDIVALLVLEHQMPVQNAIIETAQQIMAIMEDARPPGALSSSQKAELDELGDSLVSLLFCRGEAELPAGIKGTSGFRESYEKSAPRDKKGRSLSQLKLSGRLFEYPLSPLIYTPSFQAMPAAAKQIVVSKMRDVLRGRGGPEYADLDAATRQAILEIVTDTKPELGVALAGK